MKKKQVWFRPDQVELVIEGLRFTKRRMENSTSDGVAAAFAKTYTSNRIDEVIRLFEEP